MQHDEQSELGRVSSFPNSKYESPNDKPAIIPRIANAIQSNSHIKLATEVYRSTDDPLEAKSLMDKSFMGVTWCGTFTPTRQPENLSKYSGLIGLHLYSLSHKRFTWLRKRLRHDEYVHLLFTDLKGTGLVVVIQIDNETLTDHVAFTRQLLDYLQANYLVVAPDDTGSPSEVNPASLAINWLCRINHDPDVYYNADTTSMPLLPKYKVHKERDSTPDDPPLTNSSTARQTDFNNLLNDLHTEQEQATESAFKEQANEQDEANESQEYSKINEPKHIGLLTLRTANGWIEEAKLKPIPQMLFDEFWLEGEICFLFAEANQGKSILAVQIGDSISRGQPIKGFHMQAKAQPVLYFDFELSSKQFEARYSQNFDQHYQWHDNFKRIEINPDADTPEGYSFEDYLNESMEDAIIETKSKVLIIDNVTFLRNDTETAKDAGPLMKYLKALKRKYDLSLLVLAHCPKRDASRPLTRNDLQGSSRLNQFADSMVAIGASAKDSQLKYLKQVKVRSTAYKFDSDNVAVCQIHRPSSFLMLDFVRFSAEQEHLKQPSEKDSANLSELVQGLHQQGKTQTQIATDLGISQSKVSRILSKLGPNK